MASHDLSIRAVWTNDQILLPGLPFVVPYLHAARDPTGDYLMGGFVPSTGRRSPLPATLLHEVTSRQNLVYYGWEITAVRLQQWRALLPIYYLATEQVPSDAGTPSQKWLDAAGPRLGNCGTVVTESGPRELTMVRNSAVGLTAFELSILSYWFDAPGFPLNFDHARMLRGSARGNRPGPP